MAHVQNDVKTEIMNITFSSMVYSRLEAYFSPSGSHIFVYRIQKISVTDPKSG